MVDILALFATTQMQWIVVLLGIDVILGVIAALVKKDFVFGKLCNFMKGPVLAYVFGFAVIELVGYALPSLAFIVPAVFVLVVIALLASIFGNLGKLGLPLPGTLKK
jgi:phage-related holin